MKKEFRYKEGKYLLDERGLHFWNVDDFMTPRWVLIKKWGKDKPSKKSLLEREVEATEKMSESIDDFVNGGRFNAKYPEPKIRIRKKDYYTKQEIDEKFRKLNTIDHNRELYADVWKEILK